MAQKFLFIISVILGIVFLALMFITAPAWFIYATLASGFFSFAKELL
jgi:hypothetical protein